MKYHYLPFNCCDRLAFVQGEFTRWRPRSLARACMVAFLNSETSSQGTTLLINQLPEAMPTIRHMVIESMFPSSLRLHVLSILASHFVAICICSRHGVSAWGLWHAISITQAGFIICLSVSEILCRSWAFAQPVLALAHCYRSKNQSLSQQKYFPNCCRLWRNDCPLLLCVLSVAIPSALCFRKCPL